MERKPHFRNDGVLHATINGHRFHLQRKDPIRDNFLWIDGRQPPIVLDQTAAEFISHLIDAMWLYQQGDGDESQAVIDYVVGKMAETHSKGFAPWRKKVKREQILADLNRIYGTLRGIARHGEACREPVSGLWEPQERLRPHQVFELWRGGAASFQLQDTWILSEVPGAHGGRVGGIESS